MYDFTFTRDLSPVQHIEDTCCKALKILEFILHFSFKFYLLSHLKSLYCFLVCHVLEYDNVLWYSKIDSPALLSLIIFRVPSRTTRCPIFLSIHLAFPLGIFLSNSPIDHFMQTANSDPSFSL